MDTNYNNNRYGRGGQNESGGGYSDSRFSLNATDQRSQFPQGSHYYGAGSLSLFSLHFPSLHFTSFHIFFLS